MTDIPTAPDDKPSNLRAKLLPIIRRQISEPLASDYLEEMMLHVEQYGREQRLLGRKDVTLCLEDTYNEVEADTSDYFSDEFKHGYKSAVHDSRIDNEKYIADLQAIDTTLRNFSGQTEGEHHGASE